MAKTPTLSAPDIELVPGPPSDGRLTRIEAGEWAGWHQWAGVDPFEDKAGPFYVGRDQTGLVCGFRPHGDSCNSHGMIHGGALMTFADFSLFMLASEQGEVHGVTVTMNCEFLHAAQAGQLLLARGERTGGGRSLIFARGIITAADSADERAVLGFSGTIRRLSKAS